MTIDFILRQIGYTSFINQSQSVKSNAEPKQSQIAFDDQQKKSLAEYNNQVQSVVISK